MRGQYEKDSGHQHGTIHFSAERTVEEGRDDRINSERFYCIILRDEESWNKPLASSRKGIDKDRSHLHFTLLRRQQEGEATACLNSTFPPHMTYPAWYQEPCVRDSSKK